MSRIYLSNCVTEPDFQTGQIVFSKAGRDSKKFLVVLKVENGFVYVVDGKERPLSNPKRKNPKHLSKTNTVIKAEEMATNPRIRNVLKKYSEE